MSELDNAGVIVDNVAERIRVAIEQQGIHPKDLLTGVNCDMALALRTVIDVVQEQQAVIDWLASIVIELREKGAKR